MALDVIKHFIALHVVKRRRLPAEIAGPALSHGLCVPGGMCPPRLCFGCWSRTSIWELLRPIVTLAKPKVGFSSPCSSQPSHAVFLVAESTFSFVFPLHSPTPALTHWWPHRFTPSLPWVLSPGGMKNSLGKFPALFSWIEALKKGRYPCSIAALVICFLKRQMFRK